MKYVFWSSLQLLSEMFFMLRRIEREIWSSTYTGIQVKYQLFLSDFNESLTFSTNFRTTLKYSPQCHHMSFVDFVVLPPGHGRSVTDFWGWDAHEAQLRCPDAVWVVIEEYVVPVGALNLNSTNLPRPWSPWESSPSRKIPTVEPGI